MITLEPLIPEEFQAFEQAVVEFYAEQSVAAGKIEPENARGWSLQAATKLLADGIFTPGHHFYGIWSPNGEQVGYLWCGADRDMPVKLHLYALVVFEEHRGSGYGKRAMGALEKLALEKGYSQIGLHVFAVNTPAVQLYRSMGFSETELVMSKTLRR